MQSIKTETAHLKIVVCDDVTARRKLLGFDPYTNTSNLEVMVIDDYNVFYDCGSQEIYHSGQAPFIQSRYIMDLITASQRDIVLGVSYETNIPPHILQAVNVIEFVPFKDGAIVSSADKAKKLRSVYKRFHLCVSFGSYEAFDTTLHNLSGNLILNIEGMRVNVK